MNGYTAFWILMLRQYCPKSYFYQLYINPTIHTRYILSYLKRDSSLASLNIIKFIMIKNLNIKNIQLVFYKY